VGVLISEINDVDSFASMFVAEDVNIDVSENTFVTDDVLVDVNGGVGILTVVSSAIIEADIFVILFGNVANRVEPIFVSSESVVAADIDTFLVVFVEMNGSTGLSGKRDSKIVDDDTYFVVSVDVLVGEDVVNI